MLKAGWRSCRHPVVLLLFSGLLHQRRLRDVGHGSEILDWAHCNVREREAIRGHAVDQQLDAPVVLAVVEPEFTVGFEDPGSQGRRAGADPRRRDVFPAGAARALSRAPAA